MSRTDAQNGLDFYFKIKERSFDVSRLLYAYYIIFVREPQGHKHAKLNNVFSMIIDDYLKRFKQD